MSHGGWSNLHSEPVSHFGCLVHMNQKDQDWQAESQSVAEARAVEEITSLNPHDSPINHILLFSPFYR